MTLDSKLGEGTQVRFTLPMASLQDSAHQKNVRQLSDKRLLFVTYNSSSHVDYMQHAVESGSICQNIELSEAGYFLTQDKNDPQFDIVIVMVPYVDQRVANFARTIRANRHYRDILLVLVLPQTKNFNYEKEQALISGYHNVVSNMQSSLFIEALAIFIQEWQQKGVDVVAMKPLAASSKVLVIEDNLINQKVIRLLLGELGFDAEIAPNGNKGLTAIDQNSYSAVFVDIGLPDISGLDVISQLRGRPDDKSRLPVIVLTADGSLSNEHSFKQRGIDAYLVKPITLGQLRDTLLPFFVFQEAV